VGGVGGGGGGGGGEGGRGGGGGGRGVMPLGSRPVCALQLGVVPVLAVSAGWGSKPFRRMPSAVLVVRTALIRRPMTSAVVAAFRRIWVVAFTRGVIAGVIAALRDAVSAGVIKV